MDIEQKRQLVFADLWNGLAEIKNLEIEIAELNLEKEKNLLNLYGGTENTSAQSYIKGVSSNIEKYKSSLDALLQTKFEKLQEKVAKLPDEKIEEYYKEFLKKD